MRVGGALRSENDCFPIVSTLRVDSDEDGVFWGARQRVAHVCNFLSQSDQLGRSWIRLLFSVPPVTPVWLLRVAVLSQVHSLHFELTEELCECILEG